MNIQFKLNSTVIWTSTNIRMAEAFCQACEEIAGADYVPTLTSGLEGIHSEESGHYYGRALDFRSHDLPNDGEILWKIKQRFEEILGADFLCLLEDNHFHLQRDRHSF